jgi:hypothetical protein
VLAQRNLALTDYLKSENASGSVCGSDELPKLNFGTQASPSTESALKIFHDSRNFVTPNND